MQNVVEKSKMENERKGKAVGSALFEARGTDARGVTVEGIDELRSALPKSSRFLLPKSFTQHETDFGHAPKGSVLSCQLRRPPAKATAAARSKPQPSAKSEGSHTKNKHGKTDLAKDSVVEAVAFPAFPLQSCEVC